MMHLVDWLIVLVPLLIVFFIALKAQKYIKGVADFLAASRVAGRYVLCVAGGEASMGLISLVAMFEAYYQAGFAYGFWNQIAAPLGIIFLLTGYCIYRYRETRAMTMGQFFEIRYNRPFRIFAATLQSVSGVINYALFPAVSARFLVYYCDLPLHVSIMGYEFSTFGLVMAAFLTTAVVIVTMGGQITIMVTDCIQGLLSYPLYAIIVVYLLMKFSWSNEMAPVLLDQPDGKSLLNPFDVEKLRDFNLFYVFVGIISQVLNRMAWSGTQGYNAAALNAHESKMGAVLGTWRAGFSTMMYIVLAVAGFTYLNHANYAEPAYECREELAWKAVNDVAVDERFDQVKLEIREYLDTRTISPALRERIGATADADLGDEPMRVVVKDALAAEDPSAAQTFGTIFGQMRVPLALRHILPVGITGIFCAICIFLLISTDTTYMHSWGSIIVQDIMLPLRKTPFTPRQQLLWLRLIIAGVAVFAFLFSYFFAQVDFILMFFAITGAIWLGGAGPCIIGGLYWKRGTTAGAFSALIAGSSIATGGMILQKIWVPTVYPWLESGGYVDRLATVLGTMSRPFEPYVVWRVTPDKFPINSQEIYFLAMAIGIGLYMGVSWLTCREPFNMDRMLHRGKYTRKGEKEVMRDKLTWRNVFTKLMGINAEYTRGDRILAWSVFIYSFGWGFGSFLVIVVWNTFSSWPDNWWAHWFMIQNLIVPGIVAVVSTVWFTIGGTIDLRRLFQRLEAKEIDILDDGRVIGHVSADDVSLVEHVDHVRLEEAHIEERKLEQALEEEHDEEDLDDLRDKMRDDEK
jgi:Na+/proline symporter